MIMDHPPLFLASKSPRRQELLRAAGFTFEILDLDVPEDFPPDMVVEEIPEFLARKKAENAIPRIPAESVVITADSIVVLDNIVFGKPSTPEDAIRMISTLTGRQHLVITGVFIGGRKKGISFVDYTSVWLEPMTLREIEYYVTHFPPLDKAGAYGIQDWIGWTRVSRLEGSYANVMGLPVHKVYDVLKSWND